MGIEITVIDIIMFIILTLMFIGIEVFVKWEIKLNVILKTIPAAMFFSALLIITWYMLQPGGN
jgi:hypothetical protein